ncbi:response regulator [Pseudaminobacter sp. 19-2017]|uniref:Response regulator n=1 Tax=Pseudaminobacter soli (ex Zhang et al. 2022) TaxID=2831468 RepID=A0A942DYG3_9HYPH|nr:response regulator [Pseudaminobacter soli]MBS3647681.1 response regulator [Pseudaminobacter soli]
MLPVAAISSGEGGAGWREPLRILVVEDEFLLALVLEDDLAAAGYTVVGPYNSLSSAMAASQREAFDVAILDVNLDGEMVYPLADDLIARGMRFIFLTGYVANDLPERFRKSNRLPKPYDPAALLREIARVRSGN